MSKEVIDGLRRDFEVLRNEMYSQVSNLRERISRLEGITIQLVERINDLDKRIDGLDKRVDALDKRVDALDRRIDGLDRRIDSLDKRIESLDKRIDYIARISWVLTGTVIATLIANIVVHMIK